MTAVASLQSLSIFPERRNWRAMADEMKAKGVSYNGQAQAIGMSFSSYQRVLEGVEPRHSVGEAIRQLHEMTTRVDTLA